jgi:virginiamycin B lyase
MAVTFTSYPLGPNAVPSSIVSGPDSNLWFTIPSDGAAGVVQPAELGVISPSTGAISYYPTPDQSVFSSPSSIVSGPAGDLWFLAPSQFPDQYDSAIMSFNVTTHTFIGYPIAVAGADPTDLAVGSDGNLWFTDRGTDSIGMFSTAAHTITEFPLPNENDIPTRIAPGPEGDLWFIVGLVNPLGSAVGDINPSTHAINVTDLPASDGAATAITAGSDGNIWLTNVEGGNVIPYTVNLISFDPTTLAATNYSGGGVGGITTGPDGNIWYDGDLGEFNLTSHTASTYPLPGGLGGNGGLGERTIVTGPDGNVWVTAPGYVFSAHIIPSTQSAVAGYVYADAVGTGTGGTIDAISPLANQTVFLDLKGDGEFDPGDPYANTDSLGYYTFTGLAPGTYTVRLVPYPGTIATYPNNSTQTVTVAAGQLGSPSQLGLLASSSVQPLAYDPTPFGTDNPDLQTAEVTGLYNLILGRAPDPAGLATWVQALKNGSTVQAVATAFLTSPEYDTNLILSYYRSYLADSNPGSAAVNEWVGFMQAGMTAKQAAYYFMSSDVFSNLFPSNVSFIQALYGDVLGYLPASWEIASWLNVLGEGVTRAQAVNAFLDSSASDTRIVTGLYGTIFVRAVDPNSLTAYVAALQAGWTPVQVATSLFGSAEFTARANATVG